MSKRAIASIDLSDIVPGIAPTKAPIYEWLDPAALRVDPTYQRDLSDASRRLIGKMVARWDWRKFKPPVAVLTEEGDFDLLDGQHTAIAAASHPMIDRIPVQIVEADHVDERAEVFIGINRDRLAVTSTQMHVALVAAGDPDALAVQRVCDAAGVTVLRISPGAGCFKPRQTMAISGIGLLIRERGAHRALEVLQILAAAECTPIELGQIKAVDLLLADDEFQALDHQSLVGTIKNTALTAVRDPKAFAETHGVPRWRAMASIWFKASRKKRLTPADPIRLAFAPPPMSPKVAAGPKRDKRPANGNWCPGPFAKRCTECDETFVGGQAALVCADCGYAEEGAAA